MFFSFNDGLKEISVDNIDGNGVVAGFLTVEELHEIYPKFGFAASTVESCGAMSKYFRSGVEVYDDYTFTELRIYHSSNPNAEDDCMALYIKKDLFLVIDSNDTDRSTNHRFTTALKRFPPKNITLEKIIFAFFDALISNDIIAIEAKGAKINALEDAIIDDETDKNFNRTLLGIKRDLQHLHNYYEQILDITETFAEDENDLFMADELHYISNLSAKTTRLREDVDSLSGSVVHLQDAYSTSIDLKMNNVMKALTVVATIFMPLTLIVGWYGMNLKMPEYTWNYGYIYVIVMSLIVCVSFWIISKKKKWF